MNCEEYPRFSIAMRLTAVGVFDIRFRPLIAGASQMYMSALILGSSKTGNPIVSMSTMGRFDANPAPPQDLATGLNVDAAAAAEDAMEALGAGLKILLVGGE
jgi:hypothetical protein